MKWANNILIITGAAWAKKLQQIVKEEDPTRPATASMNYAKPDMPFPANMDIISLNYQGEGIRDAPAYAHLKGIRTSHHCILRSIKNFPVS